VTNLLDLVEEGTRGGGSIRFLPDDPEPRSLASLWAESEVTARWVNAVAGPGGAVAALLSTSYACVASMFGAWRAGATLGSLPLPGRGVDTDEYAGQVVQMCRMLGAEVVLIDATYRAMLPELPGVKVATFDDVLSGGPTCDVERTGTLVQFTSGSTGRPKGVVLSMDAIGANVSSIISLVTRPGDVSCSWLPLSHDMGLIGMLLAAMAACAPAVGLQELVMITPEAFMANPAIWLKTCSQFNVTATTAPNFAFELAARTAKWSKNLDLSSLRMCITGAERVRADTLRRFAAAFEGAGFDPVAVCPAYGLAEATLAVTILPRDETWTSRTVSREALADGSWVELPAGADEGAELVSNGPPIPDMQVRVGTPDGVGDDAVSEIEITGPSMLDRYLGADLTLTDDGWYPTRDLGRVIDGELFVVGRIDDMITVGGRNIYASDVEAALSNVDGVRSGNCAVVASDDGRYVIVAEPRSNGRAVADLEASCRQLKTEASRRIGTSASSVVFIAPGSMPKTPSGKLQRHRVRAGFEAGTLSVLTRVDFGRRD
jgi:acyl-CoA synthetase (AMP-forming)/AMP-acid ligase II